MHFIWKNKKKVIMNCSLKRHIGSFRERMSVSQLLTNTLKDSDVLAISLYPKQSISKKSYIKQSVEE